MLSPLLQLTANCDTELGYVGEVTSQIQPEDNFYWRNSFGKWGEKSYDSILFNTTVVKGASLADKLKST